MKCAAAAAAFDAVVDARLAADGEGGGDVRFLRALVEELHMRGWPVCAEAIAVVADAATDHVDFNGEGL